MRGHKGHQGFWIAIALEGKSVDGLAHLWCCMDTEPERPHLACRSRLKGGVNAGLVWRDDLPLCQTCLNISRRYGRQSYDPPLFPFVGEDYNTYKARLNLKGVRPLGVIIKKGG